MSRADTAYDLGLATDALRNIVVTAQVALNSTLEAEGLELVTHFWSTEHGECYDCGGPAAYKLAHIAVADGVDFLLCSVCAAYHASHGDEIVFLNDEEEE